MIPIISYLTTVLLFILIVVGYEMTNRQKSDTGRIEKILSNTFLSLCLLFLVLNAIFNTPKK